MQQIILLTVAQTILVPMLSYGMHMETSGEQSGLSPPSPSKVVAKLFSDKLDTFLKFSHLSFTPMEC